MRRRILSLFVLIICVFSSCYEPRMGCIDTFSDNYDVLADEACEDCCTYPDLIFRFSHEYDGVIFRSDSAYIDDFGNVYRLDQFEFFISKVGLKGGDDVFIGARDSVELSTSNGTVLIPNDLTHISNLSFSYTTCELAAELTTLEVVFDLGIAYDLDGLDFDELSNSNTLKIFEDSLYLGDRFAFGEIQLQRDTFLPEIDLILLDHLSSLGTQNFVFEEIVNKGAGVIVNLNIDYKLLMSGINVKNDVAADIKQKLTDNLTTAIYIP